MRTPEEQVRYAASITPSPRQLAWQQLEFYAFTHFGMNTFTNREWGDGTEDPALFNPDALDADQWVAAVKSAGMKALILTCKHHDGFCLWPSAYTEHSVKNSPWKNGQGDVVREVSDACRRGGIKFGVYLSPWDRHDARYGQGKPYDDYFVSQLTELATNYGDIFCFWFDGACGEGKNGKKQIYDWERYYAVLRKLQPNAVLNVCGPDVRWCGNEAGHCRKAEWSVVPAELRDAERTASKSQQADDGEFSRKIDFQDEDAHTGNQIMAINTLFQLLALREQDPELLQKAAQILFMPDLFAALLGAEPVCERSIASTSQMLDPRTGQWSREVLAAYGLPENRFAPIVASGTVTGTLANGAKIIAVAGHDTQCASAAMPCAEEDAEHTAFLSCGTWSLLGTELDAPILTADSCQSGLSNELGANGKINYLKNIIGLWLIQESRREYKRRGQAYSFAELEQQALAAEPLRSFIDPDAPEFVAPGDLPGRIQEFCRKTGQPVPETVGAVMRCIYESLALKYRYAIEQLSAVTGRAFTTLHVLGGGTKDRLLCQMTADCCGLTVKAGPVEATALGNIMIQLKALGLLDSITQGRRLIAETEVIKTYTPSTQNYAEWNAAYDRFKPLL